MIKLSKYLDNFQMCEYFFNMLLQIWSLPTRKFIWSMVGHSNRVRPAQFSNDSTMAVSCSDDRTVKLWDVGAHTNLHTFYDHQE